MIHLVFSALKGVRSQGTASFCTQKQLKDALWMSSLLTGWMLKSCSKTQCNALSSCRSAYSQSPLSFPPFFPPKKLKKQSSSLVIWVPCLLQKIKRNKGFPQECFHNGPWLTLTFIMAPNQHSSSQLLRNSFPSLFFFYHLACSKWKKNNPYYQ